MTDKEKIERLESMVKTLAGAVQRLTGIVSTGSWEYSLGDVIMGLSSVEEYEYQPHRTDTK